MPASASYYEALLEQTDIEKVARELLALDLERRGRDLVGRCPSGHASESGTSFTITPAGQVFHCFNCGEGGNALHLVELARFGEVTKGGSSESHRAARDELADFVGMPRLGGGGRSPEQVARVEAERAEEGRMRELLADAFRYYHDSLEPEHYEFLRERYGLTEATITELRIGYSTGLGLRDYLKARGFEQDEIDRSGLFIKVGKKFKPFYVERYVFPYWLRGEAVYSIGRQTERTPDHPWERNAKYRKQLTRSEKHDYVSPAIRNDYFWGEDAAAGAKEVLITEGMTDAILAHQLGFACISPVTIRFRKADHGKLERLARHAEVVYLCNDSEENEAGEGGALDTAEFLDGKGRDVRIVVLPRPDGVSKVDLNDFLREHTPDEFRKLLDGAPKYPEFLYARIGAAKDLQAGIDGFLDYLARRDEITGELHVTRMAKDHRIKVDVLREELAKKRRAAGAHVADGRPVIQVNQQPHAIHAAIADALVRENGRDPRKPRFFRQGRRLVRLQRDADGQLEVSHLDSDALYAEACGAGHFVELTQKGAEIPRDPEKKWCAAAASLIFRERKFPLFAGIVGVPTMRADGTILDEPGYDEETGLYYDPAPRLSVEFREHPTREQLELAVKTLSEPFIDFPFKGKADRVTILALPLTLVALPALRGHRPFFVVTAPNESNGKTLLLDVIMLIAFGFIIGASGLPRSRGRIDEAELDKRITSLLLAGFLLNVIDNADGEIQSESLERLATQEVYVGRRLQQSESTLPPNNAVWAINGNKISLLGSLPRRCALSELDSERPEGEERDPSAFKHHPLPPWVLENRGKLLGAALTIWRGWHEAGRPGPQPGTPHLSSFPEWVHDVGGALWNAGVKDFLRNANKTHTAPRAKRAQWAAFELQLHAVFKEDPEESADGVSRSHPFTAGEVVSKFDGVADYLPDGLKASIDDDKQGSREIRLGKALSNNAGKRFRVDDGRKVHLELRETGTKHKGSNRYRVVIERPESGWRPEKDATPDEDETKIEAEPPAPTPFPASETPI